MKDLNLVREVKKGIILWYDIPKESKVLYFGSNSDPVYEALLGSGAEVSVYSGSEQDVLVSGIYDYVISIAEPEKHKAPAELLKKWRTLLKPDGRLLLGMNNRMGLRYFCGDRDPYTGRSFDGIEGYQHAYTKAEDTYLGQCYDEAELREMIAKAGFEKCCFFSVMSDLDEAVMLFREDFVPTEDLATRLTSRYVYPDTVFLAEENLYNGIVKNGLFHKMANAFFIECFNEGVPKDVLQATLSLSRGAESALITLVRDKTSVEKRAVYAEGQKRLDTIRTNLDKLKQAGIRVVDSERIGTSLLMPYMDAPIGQVYLRDLLRTDVDGFLKALDHFRDLILSSSEHVKEDVGDGEGVILKHGFIDMVPLNSFYIDGDFVFFDQEFCEDDYPANAIISRMVWTVYERNPEYAKYYPMDKVLERYGLLKERERWRKMDTEFFKDILDREELREERRHHYSNGSVIDSNRMRMSYTSDEYQKVFVDIFEGLEQKKLILFGSGNYAKRFLELYGPDYEVYAVIDNKQEKWGTKLGEVEISSPSMLKDLESDSYCVLICIKNFASLVPQLESLGVKDYRIYDAGHNYPRKRKPIVSRSVDRSAEQTSAKKKYHIGYVAGVFDLFHIGHLNLIKRAKEMCDYLIVGVVSDSGVKRDKNSESFISLEERKEIVASCRYVDEVVEVPPTYSSIEETFRLYHYDVQFSGDDHADDPVWLEAKAYLNKHGADIVFFPYTESTSSTKLKKLIDKKLL